MAECIDAHRRHRYKYGPVWFPVKSLFSAINTTDSCGEWTQDEVNDPPEWTIPASNGESATLCAKKLCGCCMG